MGQAIDSRHGRKRPTRHSATSSVLATVALAVLGCGENRVDGLLSDLSHPDAAVRRTAIKALGELDSPAENVIAAIRDSADDPDRDVRRIAVSSLGQLDTSSGEPILEAALDDEELSVRMAAAYAVLDGTPNHERAIEILSGAMKSGDGGVIVRAGHEQFVWAVPTLAELLRDRRPGTRRIAADSLGLIGPPAVGALPALENAKQDSDDRVRDAAVAAIEAIRATSP